MNRLNKKCFVASAGLHLLIGLVAFVGPAFTSDKPIEVPDMPLINFEPDILVDANVVGGGNPNARPPVVQPQSQPQPQPPAPAPQPRTPEVAKQPEPEPEKPQPDPNSFAEEKPKQKREIKVNTKLETRQVPTKAKETVSARARETQIALQQAIQALNGISSSISRGTSSPLIVDTDSFGPGGPGLSYASYRAYVQKKYYDAWLPPEDVTIESAVADVRIVIMRDGRVRVSEFVTRSGDRQVDASIQRALDRVPTIGRPLPSGAKESERVYILRFDLRVKRALA